MGAHRNQAVKMLIEPNWSRPDIEWSYCWSGWCLMADQEQLKLLSQGAGAWNAWRSRHPEISPDLFEANLRRANLNRADLSEADLNRADLSRANLIGANLSRADLIGANLSRANLIAADLIGANLSEANLGRADLSGADLSGALLNKAILAETNLSKANIADCNVYGVFAWNVTLDEARQTDLIVTPRGEPLITVDNLGVAQFIYLLLSNEELREVIDTVTANAVLVLGRFTPERKAVLDRLREALRSRGYLPILFDCDKSAGRDLTETISTLAHLARFIIVDLTEARGIPHELQRIVPDLPSVPIQPFLASSDREYARLEDFKDYPWVLRPYRYKNQETLLENLEKKVIAPAEKRKGSRRSGAQ